MRRWIAIGVVLAAIAVIAWWRLRGDEAMVRKTHATRLDPQKLRKEQAARLERAKQLAARPRSNPVQATELIDRIFRSLVDPCALGPRAMCDAIAELIVACEGGDAEECTAIGEFLQDTPPRPLIAIVFFMQGCKLGDEAACKRFELLKHPPEVACDADVALCAARAYRATPPDRTLLDESCALGVADSCGYMAYLTETDAEQSRAYYEAGCQLGSPMMCQELGERLAAGCKTNDIRPTCYPPDPAESKTALDMACASGFGNGCAP